MIDCQSTHESAIRARSIGGTKTGELEIPRSELLQSLFNCLFSFRRSKPRGQGSRYRRQRHCQGPGVAQRRFFVDVLEQTHYADSRLLIPATDRRHKDHRDTGATVISSLNPTPSYTMCYMEDVFHVKCGHWGRRSFVGEPCVRSRRVRSRLIGCSEVEVVGMANCSQLCWLCKRHEVSSTRPESVVFSSASASSTSLITTASGQSQQTTSRTTTTTTSNQAASLKSESISNSISTRATESSTTSTVATEAWVTGRSPNPRPLTSEQLQRLMLYGKLNFLS